MNFKVVRTMVTGTLHIVADKDGKHDTVSELVFRWGKWDLYHVHSFHVLTVDEREEMNEFAKQYIAVMDVTRRLTK